MRSLLMSLALLGLVGGVVAYGFASFVDTETSENNVVSTGVGPDLQLSDSDEAFELGPGDGVTGSWVRLNVKPGDDLQCATISARNVSPTTGSAMDIQFVNTIDDPPGPESDTGDGTTTGLAMAAYVELSSLMWDSQNLLPLVNGGLDSVPGKSLADLQMQGGFTGLSGLLGTPPDGAKALALCFQFRSDAGNQFQGKTLYTDVVFTLR
ncbi:MAG TPA: hypothetical protein VNN12_00070, partial [Dehalococcoidia bacterium]|nr:hypothetical protein [Dehalococcoidia bacterium]